MSRPVRARLPNPDLTATPADDDGRGPAPGHGRPLPGTPWSAPRARSPYGLRATGDSAGEGTGRPASDGEPTIRRRPGDDRMWWRFSA
jgi:hypothetical protein